MAKLKIGQKLKQMVGIVAPTIGTALGGPFGGMAGKFVQDALGVDSEDAAIAQLESDPAAFVKLKQANLDFETHLSDNDVKLEDIAARDRDSARKLAMTKGIVPQVVLSVVYSVGYFWVVWLYLTGRVNVMLEQQAMIAALVGVLTAAQAQIMNFWMGSSHGSSKKTDILANGKA